ncbi:thermonuclease family protein [Bradyrhizobium tropiciagri]|uniref:thermonuclease family protein n=1 Tax=Bradyrhizobium tropiciagri TaxID=312253 RepID=UPI001BABCD0F|nr:thermonuclease family protein [Bradyrhizobium tropiciagri]MBR0871748.1 thermonuclease family protein [Bradyrhizobium tropiciagri]
MSPYERTNPYRPPRRPPFGGPFPRRSIWGRRFTSALPWVFVLGIAAGSMLPFRQWVHLPSHWPLGRSQETDVIWQRAGTSDARLSIDVIRTIDGDTFEARVHLSSGPDVTARVRLRGIDAPELKASCARELRMAEAATSALRDLLSQGNVAIYNIGPDKYGRVLADVATKRTDSVSAAMLAAGHARAYNGGHRFGWCGNAAR